MRTLFTVVSIITLAVCRAPGETQTGAADTTAEKDRVQLGRLRRLLEKHRSMMKGM